MDKIKGVDEDAEKALAERKRVEKKIFIENFVGPMKNDTAKEVFKVTDETVFDPTTGELANPDDYDDKSNDIAISDLTIEELLKKNGDVENVKKVFRVTDKTVFDPTTGELSNMDTDEADDLNDTDLTIEERLKNNDVESSKVLVFDEKSGRLI